MEHRKNNNHGYKKIYPMSLFEDDSFCHYCGRQVNTELGLEWDHVPALNVKIPDEYGIEHSIRKTLVRSCSECNSLASDTPHLDYLERHLWLKVQYMRRYKSVLISSDPKDKDEVVSITGKRNSLSFHKLLSMLGFGLKDIDMIKSPILQLKNKPSARKVENLIAEHLTNSPHEIEDEPEKELVFEKKGHSEATKQKLTIPFLKEFLLDEWLSGNKITTTEMFEEWIINNPGRAHGLAISLDDTKLVEGVFGRIVDEVAENFQKELKKNDDIPIDLDDEHFTINEEINRSEISNNDSAKKIKRKIIAAFLAATDVDSLLEKEGRYNNPNLLSKSEFLKFISLTKLSDEMYKNFMYDKNFKHYNRYFPIDPEVFYQVKIDYW